MVAALKSTLYFLITVCVVLAGCSAKDNGIEPLPDSGQPVFEIEVSHLDLPSSKASPESLIADFPFVNRGTGDLVIQHVRRSCNCAIVSVSPPRIPPGQHGVIRMHLDRSKLGFFQASAVIVSNAMKTPEVHVSSSWLVKTKLLIAPTELYGIDLNPGESRSVELDLELDEGVSADDVRVESASDFATPHITHDAQIAPDGRKVSYSFLAAEDAIPGNYMGRLELRVAGEEQSLFVPWSVNVRATLTVAPQNLWFRETETGLSTAQLIIRTKEPEQIESIKLLDTTRPEAKPLDVDVQVNRKSSTLVIMDLTGNAAEVKSIDSILVQTECGKASVTINVRHE